MGQWFSKYYDRLMNPLERKSFSEIRTKLIGQAYGRVLEIGAGTGMNFPYYRHAERVIAIEPSAFMSRQSVDRVQSAAVPIEVMSASAERLPFPDCDFDTVVGTLVLCSVSDPVRSLHEIRRVCKPGGRLLFFEHVKLNHPLLGWLQNCLTPVWSKLCDGCHLNRNTLEMMENEGFLLTKVERYYKGLFLVIEAINEDRYGGERH